MNRLYSRAGAFALSSALCLMSVGRLSAQTTAAPAAAKPADEETITLSPFIVEADTDQGYAAKESLAGTRVRTELRDIASAISVVTKQFLQDTGSKNSNDLLVYTPSTEVAGIRGNFSGMAGGAIYSENTVSSTTRVRGLDQADNTRDYFLTDIPWDGFNVGRVDLQRGPNSILFGTGSPAGIVNTSVNDASFKTAYNVENRVGQFGSLRNSVSLNQSLIKDVLAIRVAAVVDDEKYEQKPAFNSSKRYYGALRLDPKLFGEDSHTSFRAKYETGKVNSNNPRSAPPIDEITPWFKTGRDAYGNPGLNKLTINQYSNTNANPSGVPLPGATGSALSSATFELGGWAQTRSYWPDVINYYEGTARSNNTLANPANPSGTPIQTITAQANTGNALVGGAINGISVFRPFGIPSMSQYASFVGTVSGYPGSPIPGGVYYADSTLTDTSLFNFYKKLLDGPNKKEWQSWDAMNFALDQSFFNDRLAFQFAFDHQDYDQGSNQWMTGSNYAISVDVNQTYADGSANPNVGRPYAGNAASNPNYAFHTVRDTFRFTPTGELRAEDFLGKSSLSKILGKHIFTGLYESNSLVRNTVSWAEFATTPDYITSNSPNRNAANTLGSNRSFEWISYLGGSLANKSSAAGANLANLVLIEPPGRQAVRNFNSRWNRPTNPNDPNYVDPTAPYVGSNTQTGAVSNTTQANNPANYIGWQDQQIAWMRADNPADYPSLVSSATRTRYRDISTGVTWQGYLLDGDLVPTFGYRKDKVTSYETGAPQDQFTGFTSLNYDDNQASRSDVTGTSKSWGGVYHLPKSLVSKLPGDMTVSLMFNKGQNFKPDAARLSLGGVHIPNATGTTTEYGFTVTAFHEKLSLKINRFETKVKNATLASTNNNDIGGLGNNGYFLADGVIWGYAWAASLQDGLRGQTPGTTYWDYTAATSGRYSTASITTDAQERAYDQTIVDAWLKIPLPAGYFRSFNLQPDIDPTIGAKSGNLRDSMIGGYADQNGPAPGGGSQFGNHQTTVDNLSKGVEIELSAQPSKNWNLTMNYTKVSASHDNVDLASQEFIGNMTAFMNGPGGQVREWFNGGGTVGSQWNSSIVAPFTVLLNQQGHEAPEVAPWRLNLVSTYTFDRGHLKGLFVGGALRTEGGRIIGYKFDSKVKNVNSTDPRYAGVTALTLGGLDVNQPFRSSTETHVDAWVGYSRKLSHNLNWRIQANFKAVGEKDHLIASRLQPDGSIALARISQGMGWELTNSIDF